MRLNQVTGPHKVISLYYHPCIKSLPEIVETGIVVSETRLLPFQSSYATNLVIRSCKTWFHTSWKPDFITQYNRNRKEGGTGETLQALISVSSQELNQVAEETLDFQTFKNITFFSWVSLRQQLLKNVNPPSLSTSSESAWGQHFGR